MEISELNLDIRTFNAVCRAGFRTAEELFQAMGEDQTSLQLLIGRNNFERVNAAFAELEDKGMLDFTTKLPPAPAEQTVLFSVQAKKNFSFRSASRISG